MLLLGGRPIAQSYLMGGLLAVNVASNFALVPILGPLGAAIATGFTWLSLGVGTVWLNRRLLGVNLLTRATV